MERILNVFGEPLRDVIRGKDGKPILLNELEQRRANFLERYANALGFDLPITTMTTIVKKVTEQKFFTVAPAKYLPVVVGNGAWSDFLLTYVTSDLAGDFNNGILNNGQDNSRLAAADTGITGVQIATVPWAKKIGWNLIQLQQAAKSGSWDLIASKEESRKRNWDLGIQKIAFLGISGMPGVLGLYNQAGITTDLTTLTGPISNLDAADLSAFIAQILEVYRDNCQRSAWPTHFIIPESDYLGLATPSSSEFPLKSKLTLLMETLVDMTGNKEFKVLPNAYGNAKYNGLGVDKYVLLNYDEKSIRMDIPVDYTNTLANSLDNFSYQNAAYGQFTGVQAYRPSEMYYFQFSASI